MIIDPAHDRDLPAILEIHNHEIREGTSLWNTRERTLPEMRAWFEERRSGGCPVLAARAEGALIGYGGYGSFRRHDGYAFTAEHSLYVTPQARGRGVGRVLLIAVIENARQSGKHAMVGAIEAGNAPSIALHRSLGFRETARMPEVGRKFDRWLTLVMMQLLL